MASPQNYTTVSRRPPDIEDYIDIARRHRSWIIGPTYAGLVIAVVVAFLWPNTYESTAIMRVRPQVIAPELVPSMVKMRMGERLESMRTEILSRPRLAALISRPNLNLYPRLRNRMTDQDAIDQMLKDLDIRSIEMEGTGDRRYATAFRIKFSYSDRFLAKSVVDELVSQFSNENARVQTTSARQAEGFLAEEKKSAQDALNQIQSDLARFQSENFGRLPEQSSANMQTLANHQIRLLQLNDALSRAQQNKSMLETQLKNTTRERDYYVTNVDETAPAQQVKNNNLVNLETQISAAEAALAAKLTAYDERWHEVKELRKQIDVLKQRKVEMEATLAASESTTPAAAPQKNRLTPQAQAAVQRLNADADTLRTQISNASVDIDKVTREISGLEKEIAGVSAKISASPVVQQEYERLTRDLAVRKEAYDDLVRRERMAQTTTNLEERQAGETLEVIDPANLPTDPVYPPRFLITGMGAGLGLVFGLMLAGAREAKDSSLKNLKDVRVYTNLPVLSSIPLLENALLVRRKRRLFWLAWSTAIIIGVAAMSGALYYYYFIMPKAR